ncbi:MAG: adenylyltransferase/cytidyltransferase family protein [Alphaproteobacteria bacterium]|nr:adenylyltransferase/cytidyltransferase family protein [Alphaproteobacteria bacterium]
MKKSDTVVFVSGNFFALHPGHVRVLKFAAESGDTLVVGVSATRPSNDVPPPEERAEALRELGIVDRVVVLDDGVETYLRELKPGVVIKGKEFENVPNPEEPILKEYGGRLIFASGESTYSGSDLLAHDNKASKSPRLSIPQDFLERHGLGAKQLIDRVKSFSNLSVVVVGDLIVDEYVNCEPLGMSQEEPSIVVSPQSTDRFIGGAGIVAAHAASLGASVDFLSIVGDDETGDLVAAWLPEYEVNAHLITDESRPTTLKQRFRAQDRTMLRVSHLRQHEISKEHQSQIAAKFESLCAKADLVIFSDFNYGCLPQPLIDQLANTAQKTSTMFVADSQSSSQVGDISRYKNAHLLTPTEFEARLALRDQNSGLAKMGHDLLAATDSANVFVKLGAAGVLIVSAEPAPTEQQVDRLPAFNSLPKDVSGAGDSMLTAASLALSAGASTWEAAFIGSIAAGIQTGRVGNVPISTDELTDSLTK